MFGKVNCFSSMKHLPRFQHSVNYTEYIFIGSVLGPDLK